MPSHCKTIKKKRIEIITPQPMESLTYIPQQVGKKKSGASSSRVARARSRWEKQFATFSDKERLSMILEEDSAANIMLENTTPMDTSVMGKRKPENFPDTKERKKDKRRGSTAPKSKPKITGKGNK
eukprot:10036633-Ditylum_brightwellii.AAC.1